MSHKWKSIFLTGCFSFLASLSIGDEPQRTAGPERVPLTRDAMKRALDASKLSEPRLPLPPVTKEEQAFIAQQRLLAKQSGEEPRRYGLANNGRMRAYYLADYGFSLARDLERANSGASRDSDSSLDAAFRTMLFWIVSRGNNCTYCLGHQESGLANRGLTDDELAQLDSDWSTLDEAKRAAFTFTKKLSFEPHLINDSDIAQLEKHFNPKQVSDIILAVAGFNATNRWTGPLRIRQDVLFQFERPTAPGYATAITRLGPADTSKSDQGFASPVARNRPALESREVVKSNLKAASIRKPRVALADEASTKSQLKEYPSTVTGTQWARFVANVPRSGAERFQSYQMIYETGTLPLRTKAIIAYVGARHDRAWYALGLAMQRLKDLGFSEAQIFALDTPDELASPTDRDVIKFVAKITTDPALIEDSDFDRLKKSFEDKSIAEIVYLASQAAFFDRLTEAAGLPVEAESLNALKL